MKKKKESLVENIVLKYEDGTEKKINKGVIITVGEVDSEGDTTMNFEFANCKGEDLTSIIWGVMNMADEMGMLDNIK